MDQIDKIDQLYFAGRFYQIPIVRPGANKRAVKPDHISAVGDRIAKLQDEVKILASELRLGERSTRDILLSIVVPAYNEQSRLPATVVEAIRWCAKEQLSYELIIVDDGSLDGTSEIARLFADHDKNVRLLSCPHLGKGGAVQIGMLNAVGKYVLFMDADGATPVDEIGVLMAKMDEGYPIAIGSRIRQRVDKIVVETSMQRKMIGRVFAAIVNAVGLSDMVDTQCGFKMFRKEIARELFSKQKIKGFAFDVEILYLAGRRSFAIAEVPVNWFNQKGSKVNLVTDTVKMLWDVLKIRSLHRNEI